MKVCAEVYCQKECYPKQKYCYKHYRRHLKMRERRRIPRPKPHKPGTFDLARLGAVGWRVRS